MASMEQVEHEGRIIEITQDVIRVEILSKSACASCHAKGVCSASEVKVKIVDVPLTIGTLSQHFEEGEVVNVVLKPSLGMKATILAYGVPLLVLLAAIVVSSKCGATELWTGLWGIISVAAYYVVLSFFKNRLSRTFTFSIAKTNLAK